MQIRVSVHDMCGVCDGSSNLVPRASDIFGEFSNNKKVMDIFHGNDVRDSGSRTGRDEQNGILLASHSKSIGLDWIAFVALPHLIL